MKHTVSNFMLKALTLLLVTCSYNGSGNKCLQPSLFQKVSLVHLKDGSIVKSLTRDVSLGCQSACIQTTGCKSINMRKRSDGYFDCDLLSENTSGRELKPLKDSTYYEKKCFPSPRKTNPCYPCRCVACNICEPEKCDCTTPGSEKCQGSSVKLGISYDSKKIEDSAFTASSQFHNDPPEYVPSDGRLRSNRAWVANLVAAKEVASSMS